MKSVFSLALLLTVPALSSAATLTCGDEEVQISTQISEQFVLSQVSAVREGKDLKASLDFEPRVITRGPEKGYIENAIAPWSDSCYLYLRIPPFTPIQRATVLIKCGDGTRKFPVPCLVTP